MRGDLWQPAGDRLGTREHRANLLSTCARCGSFCKRFKNKLQCSQRRRDQRLDGELLVLRHRTVRGRRARRHSLPDQRLLQSQRGLVLSGESETESFNHARWVFFFRSNIQSENSKPHTSLSAYFKA